MSFLYIGTVICAKRIPVPCAKFSYLPGCVVKEFFLCMRLLPQKFRPRLHVTVEDLENILDEAEPDLLAQPRLTPVTPATTAGGSATIYSSWRRSSIRRNSVDSGLAGASSGGGVAGNGSGGSGGVGGSSGGGGGGDGGGDFSTTATAGRWRPAAGAAAAVSAFRHAASRQWNAIGGSFTSAVLAAASGGASARATTDDEWPEAPDSAASAAMAARRASGAAPILQRSGLAALDGERRIGPREFELVLRQQMTLYIQAPLPNSLSPLFFQP